MPYDGYGPRNGPAIPGFGPKLGGRCGGWPMQLNRPEREKMNGTEHLGDRDKLIIMNPYLVDS